MQAPPKSHPLATPLILHREGPVVVVCDHIHIRFLSCQFSRYVYTTIFLFLVVQVNFSRDMVDITEGGCLPCVLSILKHGQNEPTLDVQVDIIPTRGNLDAHGNSCISHGMRSVHYDMQLH